jgi:flagellar hook assembly protein FlgD
VRVTDNGSPILFSEQTVTVNVTATALTSLTTTNLEAAEQAEEKSQPVATSASLYPNPAHQHVTVTLPQPATTVTLTILDAKGIVVRPAVQLKGGTQFQVDATTLKPGAYLLHLKMETGNQTLKFVKL